MFTHELPPRCLESCPIINGVDFDDYPGLVATRNCHGPQLATQDVSSTVYIKKDGTAEEVRKGYKSEPDQLIFTSSNEGAVVIEPWSYTGQLACRNAGINESIKRMIADCEQ